MPASVLAESAAAGGIDATVLPKLRPPRVEYLSTLSRHSAAVNVVRFSPNGEWTWVCPEIRYSGGPDVKWTLSCLRYLSHMEDPMLEITTSRVFTQPFHFLLLLKSTQRRSPSKLHESHPLA